MPPKCPTWDPITSGQKLTEGSKLLWKVDQLFQPWRTTRLGRQLPKGIGSEGAIARPPPTLTHTQTTHDVIFFGEANIEGYENSRWPPGHRGERLVDGAVGGPVAADGAPIRKRGLAVVETAATKRKTDAETATGLDIRQTPWEGRQSRGNNESHTGMSASSRVEESSRERRGGGATEGQICLTDGGVLFLLRAHLLLLVAGRCDLTARCSSSPAMLRRGSFPLGTKKRKVDGMAHQPTASSGRRSTCCDGCMPRRTGDSVPSHRDHPIDLPINTAATLGANKVSPDKFRESRGVSQRYSEFPSLSRDERGKEDDERKGWEV
ncbi:uncharacterized protein BO96DRAFT_438837 [Aspergillus niger CBS 101883]|uniref:Uncharacterized protein n=2 Tax=Aspergillus niger TaxID=5061 RepID=A2QXX1_ASPNC|nr:uncharacterized protein BO96DRAFT_438837 [Aspergillus niger CBS 101883]XP_059601683.1 hypothetical protein An11g10530 [Aspergillus niger]PYH51584.1 hypothetical protein BO96DRAFT_438837 [Aspergillus niger CBS 101883]CAK40851.1 hypothetical protein An11g10530 [Aspergillus niger]